MGAETPDNLEISSGVIKLFNSPLNQRSIVSTITASRVATLSILAVLVENKDGILGIGDDLIYLVLNGSRNAR